MSSITVRARDSAEAMDLVMRQLGEDAMILSTLSRDGQVEIVATTDPLPAQSAVRPRPAAMLDRFRSNRGFADPSTPEIKHPAPSIPVPETPDPARRVLPAARFSLSETESAELKMRAPEEVLSRPRIALVGPSGAGKSMLALQIAAALIERDRRARVRLLFCGVSRSDGAFMFQKARMLHIPADYLPPHTGLRPAGCETEIVIVSERCENQLAELRMIAGDSDCAVVVAVPAGLRGATVQSLAKRWHEMTTLAALSQSDDVRATEEDRAALAQGGLDLVWTVNRHRLADGLVAALNTALKGENA